MLAVEAIVSDSEVGLLALLSQTPNLFLLVVVLEIPSLLHSLQVARCLLVALQLAEGLLGLLRDFLPDCFAVLSGAMEFGMFVQTAEVADHLHNSAGAWNSSANTLRGHENSVA